MNKIAFDENELIKVDEIVNDDFFDDSQRSESDHSMIEEPERCNLPQSDDEQRKDNVDDQHQRTKTDVLQEILNQHFRDKPSETSVGTNNTAETTVVLDSSRGYEQQFFTNDS